VHGTTCVAAYDLCGNHAKNVRVAATWRQRESHKVARAWRDKPGGGGGLRGGGDLVGDGGGGGDLGGGGRGGGGERGGGGRGGGGERVAAVSGGGCRGGGGECGGGGLRALADLAGGGDAAGHSTGVVYGPQLCGGVNVGYPLQPLAPAPSPLATMSRLPKLAAPRKAPRGVDSNSVEKAIWMLCTSGPDSTVIVAT